jgi:hypothetical protein
VNLVQSPFLQIETIRVYHGTQHGLVRANRIRRNCDYEKLYVGESKTPRLGMGVESRPLYHLWLRHCGKLRVHVLIVTRYNFNVGIFNKIMTQYSMPQNASTAVSTFSNSHPCLCATVSMSMYMYLRVCNGVFKRRKEEIWKYIFPLSFFISF